MLGLNKIKIFLLVGSQRKFWTERKSNKYYEELSHLYVAIDKAAGGSGGFKSCKMSVEALG